MKREESKVISEIDKARLKLSIEHYIKYFIGKRTCELTKEEALNARNIILKAYKNAKTGN